jgi:TonB family protein
VTPLLALELRLTVVLAAGFAARALAARRSAAVRHAILAVTLASAALIAPLSVYGPAWTIRVGTVEAPRAPRAESPSFETDAAHAPRAASDTAPAPAASLPIVPLTWLLGTLVLLTPLAAGSWRLRRRASAATLLTDAAWSEPLTRLLAGSRVPRPVLLETDLVSAPATFGVRPARILLPPGARSWPASRIDAVLSHELAHIARHDWSIQLFSQVVLAMLWVHPLVWIACRTLARDAERACDDEVLRRGVPAADYAAELLALARLARRKASPWLPAVPAASHRSAFERRVTAMLNLQNDRRAVSRRAQLAIASAAIVMTALAGVVHLRAQGPAALTGTVYDTSGGVLPGARVTLEDRQQQRVDALTSADGRFSFPGVGSGHYTLTATLPGFRTLHDEFDLTSANDWDRAVTLQVATLRESITVRADRLAPAAAPAAAGPTRVRVGGNIRAPRKTLDVKPEYPPSMRAAGREGQVPIEAVIGVDGSVSSVRVVSAQVHPDFAIAAVDAVRQWRFTPTLLNGTPVEVVISVNVTFTLSD